MDIQHYQDRLRRLAQRTRDHLTNELALGREQTRDVPRDAGEQGVADEAASEAFTHGELDATLLQQIDDALRRIENGTFGQCIVDGGWIEPTRLEAMPWTPYCLTHQRLLEAAAEPSPPTL